MSNSDSVPLSLLQKALDKKRKALIQWLADRKIAIHRTRQHGQQVKRKDLGHDVLQKVDALISRGVTA